ncbi:hypothetical protein CC80DRAFT_414309, partial [Byssothecium circinans]
NRRMASEQSAPFLPKTESEDGEDAFHYQRKKSRSDRWFSARSCYLHGGLVLCYTIFSFLIISWQLRTDRRVAQDHDLGHAIPVEFTFKPTIFHNLSSTPYAGDKPEDDLKAAWEDLLQPMNMRFSQEEIDAVNQESVALPEGGGYLGWFGVFHSLHCVVTSITFRVVLYKADPGTENDT